MTQRSQQREAKPLQISRADIDRYQRDGAVLLEQVLDETDIELLTRGVEEAYAKPGRMRSRQQMSDGGEGETVTDQFPSMVSPSLTALLARGRIAEIAGKLMEVESAQLVLDQIHYKTRGRIAPTPWHQDTPFLSVRGLDMARVWLSCDPSPADITVQFVRGSHRWNVVYDTRSEAQSNVVSVDEGKDFTYRGIGNDRLPPMPDVARYRDSFDILSWDVEPGDAIVFNGNLLHGAFGRDYHPLPRRAYASMWGGPDLRCHRPGDRSIPTIGQLTGHQAPHGARIGDHPEEFPLYWTNT